MTTITLTVCDTAPRESTLRRLALSTGIALVRWAYRRPLPLTHEQQVLRLATEQAIAQQASSRRYGIAQ